MDYTFYRYGNYPNLSSARRILVIKLRHLGDVLLAAPVLTELKKALPEAQIDAYIWKEAKEMLEGHLALSSLILYDRAWKKLSFTQRLVKEGRLLQEIRKKSYDLVINLTEGDRGVIAAAVSKAPIRVGFKGKSKGFLNTQKMLTHVVKTSPLPRHTIEKNLDALRVIGIFPERESRSLHFVIPEAAQEEATKILKTHGLEPKGFVAIHPVSRWRYKCPPPSLFAEVIHQLPFPVVLTGGPALEEQKMCAEIERLCENRVVNLCGKTTLKELGAIFTLSAGLITVDSVALHMGSSLKVPLVALFGPTSEENWGPWQHPHSIVITEKVSCRPCFLDGCGGSKVSDCLSHLSAQKIANALLSLISQEKKKREKEKEGVTI